MGHSTRELLLASTLLLTIACGARGRSGAGDGGTAGALARLQAAHRDFAAAGAALADVEAQGAGAAPSAVAAARARFDTAYEGEQKALAVFLTLAVNERPTARETREGLELYATRAVELARLLLGRGGDPARAVAVLEGAGQPFRALGLPPPAELVACLREARQRQAGRGAAPPGTGD